MLSTAAIGTTVGPIVGGALADVQWRWIFWLNLPICIGGRILCHYTISQCHIQAKSDVEASLGSSRLYWDRDIRSISARCISKAYYGGQLVLLEFLPCCCTFMPHSTLSDNLPRPSFEISVVPSFLASRVARILFEVFES